MPSNELHIYLNEENKDKLLRIGNTLDKSATKLVNSIIADMPPEEIEDRILKILQKGLNKKRQHRVTVDD